YLHAVQVAIDPLGLRYQALDIAGNIREWLSWPVPEISPELKFFPLPVDQADKLEEIMRSYMQYVSKGPGDQWISAWRFSGIAPAACERPQSLLTGYNGAETAAGIRVMFEGYPLRLVVELQTQSGYSADRWLGPTFEPGKPFSFELALHS